MSCAHLRAARQDRTTAPRTAAGCEECRAHGWTDWVRLRACLACGHVGCCDSSPHRHATAHFRQTGHPVMRSAESGETWRWCYRDEELDPGL